MERTFLTISTLGILLTLLLSGCYRSDLDVTLEGNPFDPDYDGPSPFVFDSFDMHDVWTGEMFEQAAELRFHLNPELFQHNYPVYVLKMVHDQYVELYDQEIDAGDSYYLTYGMENNSGVRTLLYFDLTEGDELCIEMTLGNTFLPGTSSFEGLDLGSSFEHCYVVED